MKIPLEGILYMLVSVYYIPCWSCRVIHSKRNSKSNNITILEPHIRACVWNGSDMLHTFFMELLVQNNDMYISEYQVHYDLYWPMFKMPVTHAAPISNIKWLTGELMYSISVDCQA